MAKLLGRTPDAQVLVTLEAIRPADVEAALLLLPLHAAVRLLGTVARLLGGASAAAAAADGVAEDAGAASDAAVELLVRVGGALLRAHHEQVVGGAIDRRIGCPRPLAALATTVGRRRHHRRPPSPPPPLGWPQSPPCRRAATAVPRPR